jgi:hypothetical protein
MAIRARPERQIAQQEKSMKSMIKLGLAATSLVFGASLLHPFGPVKQERSDIAPLMGAGAPPEITRLVNRACQNCHSERTEWPWYSYIAPMSWMIEKDVSTARTHMNLSHWPDYTIEQRIDLLTRIAVEVRNRKMPLPKYLNMHSEARLSDDDVQRLYAWAHNERRRLKTADTKGRTSTD